MLKTIKDVMKTEKDFKDGFTIENNIITKAEVNTIAHFGNLTSFEIYCKNIVPYSNRNNAKNLGNVIKAFVELMKLEREDGVRLSEIKDIPCRLVFEGKSAYGSKAIAIGHYMDDRFILLDDLSNM